MASSLANVLRRTTQCSLIGRYCPTGPLQGRTMHRGRLALSRLMEGIAFFVDFLVMYLPLATVPGQFLSSSSRSERKTTVATPGSRNTRKRRSTRRRTGTKSGSHPIITERKRRNTGKTARITSAMSECGLSSDITDLTISGSMPRTPPMRSKTATSTDPNWTGSARSTD